MHLMCRLSHLFKRPIVAMVLILLTGGVAGQSFTRSYGSPLVDEGSQVVIASSDGNVLMGGYRADSALVLKIDPLGNVLWTRTFKPATNYPNVVYHMAITPDGFVIGNGNAIGGSPVVPRQSFFFKMDLSGNLIWTSLSDGADLLWTSRCLAKNASEYLNLSQIYQTSGTYNDIHTSRIDAANGLLISQIPKLDLVPLNSYIDDQYSGVILASGSVYSSGRCYLGGNNPASMRPFVSKYNPSGAHLWTQYYLGNSSVQMRCYGIDIIDHDDSLTVCCFGDVNGSSSNFTVQVIRMDTLGSVAWARDYDLPAFNSEISLSIVSLADGYAVGGYGIGASNVNDGFVFKISRSGSPLWARSLGQGNGSDENSKVTCTKNLMSLGSDLLMTLRSGTGGVNDILLSRMDLNGDISCDPTASININSTILSSISTAVAPASMPDPITITQGPSTAASPMMGDQCALALSLGNDTSICDSVLLLPQVVNASYIWQDGSTDSSFLALNPGVYWVTASWDCCTSTDTIVLTSSNISTIALGNDTIICVGDTLTLWAQSPGAVTTWSTGAIGPSLVVSQPGMYWAVIAVGGCTTTDTITVTSSSLMPFDLGPDTNLCTGQSLALDATTTPGATYLWSDGSTSPNNIMSTPGLFWAQASLSGCLVSDSILVTITTPPTIDLGPDTSICDGTTLTLDATTSGASYAWNNGSTGPQILAPQGTWSVLLTVNGCAATDTIMIGALPTPEVDLGNDTTLCDSASILLDATLSGASYTWQDGTTNATLMASSQGTYAVTVDFNGCSATDTIIISYFPLEIDLGPDTVLCNGEYVSWAFSLPGVNYLWNSGSVSPQFSTSLPGIVWLTISSGTCQVSDTVNIASTSLPTPLLGPSATYCEGETAVLSVNPGPASIQWSTGSNAASISVGTSGTYSVTLTLESCLSSDSITLTFIPSVTTLSLDTVMTLCPGQTLTLNAFILGATYLWSNGNTGPETTITAPGTYSVIATGLCINASASVVIPEGDCDIAINVPNCFTPEGDGINDLFGPVIKGELLDFELYIFDRWGELIFSTLEQATLWDGRYKGEPVQDGVYVWTINYRAFEGGGIRKNRLIGHVTVLR